MAAGAVLQTAVLSPWASTTDELVQVQVGVAAIIVAALEVLILTPEGRAQLRGLSLTTTRTDFTVPPD